MISKFFIDRPIFATVISIFILLMGLVSLFNLPVEQYPTITPPQILVTAFYPGASAETIAETVAAPLEQQINGIENMIYMYSQSSSSGSLTLTVFFEVGSDIDKAQIDVQNKVNLVLSKLPLDVQKQGLVVQKQSPSFLMIVALQSETERYNEIFTSNYATIHVVDELKRLPGISDVQVIGAKDYSMRIWLKPDRMAQLGITTSDIARAIQEQNSQVAVGQIGQEPLAKPVELTLPVIAQGRFTNPEEFDNIILRATPDGATVLLKSVATTELGAQNYDLIGELNGKPTTLISIYQQYGANGLEVAKNVQATMERLEKKFPTGLTFSIPYNITQFVKASIHEVNKTIFEAAILVVIIVFLFLQSSHATLIPMLALIVSIVGTFAGMYLFGLSINSLTLFGLVLSIGIVVDDAIVVIENVERNIREHKLAPKEAAIRAMEEVTGPIFAIIFVLLAVFLPVTFLSGIAGELYKQFAVTIVLSVLISGVVALTLSPALAALLLKEQPKESRWGAFFNRYLQKITNLYVEGVSWLMENVKTALFFFLLLLLSICFLFWTIPTSFVPPEDQGYLMAEAILPDSASLSRSEKVTRRMERLIEQNPAVENLVSITGYSLLEGVNKTNVASYFIILKDWKERQSAPLHAENVLKNLSSQFSNIEEALILSFNPPSIQGLGTVAGFEFWIQNRGGEDYAELQEWTEKFIQKAAEKPALKNLNATIDTDSKQLFIDLDRTKTLSLNIPIQEVYETIQAFLGSLYVNDFNKFGKVYKVMLQGEPKYRSVPEDIGEIYVRSNDKVMVPLKSIVNWRFVKGPILISRFNGFAAARITGEANSGFSSGEALTALEETAKELFPEDISYAFAGESYQEKKTAGSSTAVLFGGALLVFLILSALYENWTIPFSVLLAVPFGIFGALLAIFVFSMSNDIYFQIGLVTLIALSAKNAILIVEFAVLKKESGLSFKESALESANLRFRAILMTSLTFIFGVIPLVLSSGAGANSRISVGMGVLGGMIAATFLAIFFVPLFYQLIGEFFENKKLNKQKK